MNNSNFDRDIKLHAPALSQSLTIKDKWHSGENISLLAAENEFSSETHYEFLFLGVTK